MREYGTVISSFEGPSTRRFSFVIDRDTVVRRGQFVELETPDGKLIGRIADILKTNRYFMRPESVKEYESTGRQLNEILPVSDWEYLVADVRAIGVFSGNGFEDSSFPPSPGTRVCEPDPSILEKFFGLDSGGMHVGDFAHHGVRVTLNPTRLLQKHLAILAMSGAGKSFLAGNIIEELLDREPEKGQLAVIIIDTHGEYDSFADDPSYADRTKVFPISDIKIGLPNLNPYNLAGFSEMSTSQIRGLSKVMGSMGKSYSISDLMNAIESSEEISTKSTKEALLSVLDELRRTGLFGVADYPSMEEFVKQGQLSVMDLSETTHMKKKQIAVAYIARKLFDARKNGLIPPFLIILEEAHQYIPEKAKRDLSITSGIFQTIAREGRKFHSSLCLISQRPVQLSTTVLSQCNTQIILRVTNPYDLDHIGKSSEGITRDVQDQISSLRVGSGLILGEAVNFPLFMKIRKRRSRESKKGLPLEKAAVEYHEKVIKKMKDSKAFM